MAWNAISRAAQPHYRITAIRCLLQISAISAHALAIRTHTYRTRVQLCGCCIRDRWLREGKYFAACVRRYARICINMGAIYVGMRGHNMSTNAREYIRRRERENAICVSATKWLSEPFENIFMVKLCAKGEKWMWICYVFQGTYLSRVLNQCTWY